MASNQTEVASLGRPFMLGTLYNAQRAALITGLALWDDKTLRGKTIRSYKPSNNFVITESDSIESKSFLLDVDASLKVSFLSGMIEVEGSAKYLKDDKEFKNQSRVTGQYKSTTHFEQLSLTDLMTLEAQQKDVIIKSSATHIVTGILYGANAFFVFDSEKLNSSSVEEIRASMKAMIKKIPSFSVDSKVDIKLTEEEKALSASVSCKFFGDFNLQTIPLTYQDAVKTIGQLPQLLGENGEKAVPMKVWLMPLTTLYPEAAELKSEISVGLMVKMQDTLEDLREIQMRSNESLEDKVVQNFPHIKDDLITFQKLCHLYKSNLQGTMKEKLSSIREGKEDENSLGKPFENRDESPFSKEKLTKWLDYKEREINVIRSCVEIMEGTKIVKNQSELDREALAGDVDEAYCFVFTSTKRGDTYLDEMATYLDSHRMGSTSEDEWFYSDEALTSMREKANTFQDVTKAQKENNRIRFLIAVIPNEEYKGATIYHYKQGILVSEDSSGPDLHPEKITDRRVLTWNGCDLTLDLNTVHNNLVLTDVNKKVGEMALNQIEVAALGRPFTLGMLYDAQRDALIPGLTLWDDKTLQERTTKKSHTKSDFDIIESESIESKFFHLDVDASLKVSYLSGLIEVEGSAQYLKDQKEFKNQSRVTGQYKSTTRLEQLSMTDLMTLEPQQKDVIIKSSATHIVTGILYGANAFFVFDSEKLDSSRVEKIGGSMKAVIKKIPNFSIDGKVDIKLTEEEKALCATVSCKFFGDFNLQRIPLTFEDAVKTFGQLPQLLGEKGNNAVPMKVWLMPLTTLYPEAAELKSEISVGLVGKIEDAFDDQREIQMRSNESLEDRVVKNFPHVTEELKTFQKLCHLYTSNLQRTIKEKLSSIREGKEDERSLKKTIDNGNKSPFSQEKLIKWLDDKEREINVIRSCVDIMEGTKIVKNQSELDREALAGDVDEAYCFVFTSTKQGDAYLNEMATYLDSPRMGSTTEDEWFYSDEVLTSMRQKAKAFQDFTKAQKNNNRIRFLIAIVSNEKYKGATIYHYKQGSLVSEAASEPDPDPKKITDKRDLIWYACDLNLDPNTANNYLVLSDGNKKVTSGSTWQQYPDNPERFDVHTQVLCREGLSGRHYWEVEWSSVSVHVAVAYKTIERKGNSYSCEFGENTVSWCFGQGGTSSNDLSAWHNGNVWESPFPSGGCSTLGVYLDWPAGTLSFYKVSSNTLTHLYTFHTRFTEPVYPGFWVYYKENYAYLHPLK